MSYLWILQGGGESLPTAEPSEANASICKELDVEGSPPLQNQVLTLVLNYWEWPNCSNQRVQAYWVCFILSINIHFNSLVQNGSLTTSLCDWYFIDSGHLGWNMPYVWIYKHFSLLTHLKDHLICLMSLIRRVVPTSCSDLTSVCVCVSVVSKFVWRLHRHTLLSGPVASWGPPLWSYIRHTEHIFLACELPMNETNATV